MGLAQACPYHYLPKLTYLLDGVVCGQACGNASNGGVAEVIASEVEELQGGIQCQSL